jgi:hypothetical protein
MEPVERWHAVMVGRGVCHRRFRCLGLGGSSCSPPMCSVEVVFSFGYVVDRYVRWSPVIPWCLIVPSRSCRCLYQSLFYLNIKRAKHDLEKSTSISIHSTVEMSKHVHIENGIGVWSLTVRRQRTRLISTACSIRSHFDYKMATNNATRLGRKISIAIFVQQKKKKTSW